MAIDYYSRVENSDNELLSAAFHEQVSLELPWYKNISKLLDKHKLFVDNCNPNTKLSTHITHKMREEFIEIWKAAKASSSKLEFYNLIKKDFAPEKYLSRVTIPDVRKSLTRLRTSCHNLYIERGRYETPLVPREDRWCVYCFYSSGLKHVEDENHVLTKCPLYSPIRTKFQFHPNDQNELAGLLSDPNLSPNKITCIARAVHAIHHTPVQERG